MPFILSGCILLVSFVFLIFVVEKNPPYTSSVSEENEETTSVTTFSQELKSLVEPSQRGPLFILISMFFFFYCHSSIASQFTIYCTEFLKMTGGEATKTMGFFGVAIVAFAIPSGMLGAKYGKLPLIRLGIVFLIGIFLVAPYVSNILALRVLLFAGGAAWALIIVQAYPFVADLGGRNKVGMMTGLYYFFQTASAIVAPAIAGFLMDIFGYRTLFLVSSVSLAVALGFLQAGYMKLPKDIQLLEKNSNKLVGRTSQTIVNGQAQPDITSRDNHDSPVF